MKKSKPERRPKLPPISEEMKAWSSALAAEVSNWPNSEARSFFGFTALYRKDQMFAALPRTRSMGTANSLVFKLEDRAARLRARLDKDPRIGSMQMKKARWFTFELSRDRDLHEALEWLAIAYEAAAKPKRIK